MEGKIEISKEDLADVLWGICLSDHLGDVFGSIAPLTRAIGIEDWNDDEDLLEKMKAIDFIPEYQRD